MALVARRLDVTLRHSFGALPAVMLVGPRAAGKTTLAKALASTVVRLDDPAQAAAFQAAPDAALGALAEPVLLDEWQAVPEVLGAVKRAVDDRWEPGRFLLTGSVRARSTTATWPGTGRVVTMPLFGLSMAERTGTSGKAPFLDRLITGERTAGDSTFDLVGYIDAALTGSLPQSIAAPSNQARRQFLVSYLDDAVERDAAAFEPLRDPNGLRRFLQAWAGLSGAVAPDQTVFQLAGVNRVTGLAYESLLADLFLIERIPAWHSNRLERLTSQPKRVMLDAGFVGAAVGVDRNAVLADGHLLGRILETFVISELRAELSVAQGSPRLFHLRDDGGRHEVDVIIEFDDGRVVALEIKATSAPTRADAKHLLWLKEKLGDRLTTAAVLHTGPRRFPLDETVDAVPISEIWA